MWILLAKRTAVALAAATPVTLFDVQLLGQYDRVTVAIRNNGANPINTTAWNVGSGDILDDDTTTGTAVNGQLTAGASAVVTLTGDDIPARLQAILTSTLGTNLDIEVKANLPSADLLPRC
jgi:hypothetical protein